MAINENFQKLVAWNPRNPAIFVNSSGDTHSNDFILIIIARTQKCLVNGGAVRKKERVRIPRNNEVTI